MKFGNNRRSTLDQVVTIINRNWQGGVLLAIAIIILAAELVMPAMSSRIDALKVVLLLMLVTGIMILNIGLNKISTLFVRFLPMYIIEAVSILFLFFGGESIGVDIFLFLKMIIWSIVGWYVVQSENKKLAVIILLAIIAFYVVTSVTTLIGSNIYPGICRALTNSRDRTDDVVSFAAKMNIGGFSFVYSVVLLIPIGIYIIRNKLLNRIIVIALLVPIIMMILSAGFTTAILFTIVSIVLFLLPRGFSTKQFICGAIIGLIVSYPMLDWLGSVMMDISDNVERDNISQRLYDIGATMRGETTSQNSDFDHRVELWALDFKLFMQNPLLGSSDSGGHSFILDEMSKHGLFGIIFIIIEYVSIFKMFIKPYKNTLAFGYIVFTFVLQIGLSILNPVISHVVFVLVVPLTVFIFEGKKLPY